MTDEQWRAAWQICEAISDLPQSECQSYLESNSDPEIAAQVRAVLKSEDDGETPEAALPEPGATVGRYVLGEIIGRGGMGQVYTAEDVELGRRVALKFLPKADLFTEAAAELFIHEARAASALNHPNIVTVHEVVRSPWGLAIVMELIEGAPLRQLCGKAWPIADVLRYGGQMAQALAAAHARHIIHRDIKPENIMIRPDGYTKILDFGLARRIPLAPAIDRAVEHTLPAGTWRYMSPEQSRGEKLTPASDLFSLGLILYEMSAGSHPFPADSPFATAQAIQTQTPVPPSAKGTRIPPALDRLILNMLDRRPERRPRAEEVAHALDALLRDILAARQRNRAWVWAAGTALFLISLRVGIIAWRQITARPGLVVSQITNNESENRVTAAALSPNGTLLAYADPNSLFLRNLQNNQIRLLAAPSHFHIDRISWFPNAARFLASGYDTSTLESSLWIVAASGARPALVRAGASNGAVSPDGMLLAFTTDRESEIWIAGPGGQQPCKVISGGPSDTFPVVFWAANGKRICVERRRYRPGHGMESRLAGESEANYELSYESVAIPSGKILAFSNDLPMTSACALKNGRIYFLRAGFPGDRWTVNLWEVNTNQATGALLDRPVQLTRLRILTKAFDLTATADGKRMTAIFERDEPDVYVADLQPGPRLVNAKRLTLDSKADFPHAWTPDSRAVIFESDRDGNFDLFRQSPEEQVPETMVAAPSDDVLAQAAPGGRWLLYESGSADGKWSQWQLTRVPLSGGEPQKILDGDPRIQFRCPVAASGGCVLREDQAHRQFVFYALDPIKGRGRELARTSWTTNLVGDWDVSPDGFTVAMPDHNAPVARIRLVSLNPSSAEPRERDIDVPQFGPLRSVTWAVGQKGWFAAAQMRSDQHFTADQLIYIAPDGRARLLHQSVSNTWAVPSPDGRRLAFVDDGVDSNVWLLQRF